MKSFLIGSLPHKNKEDALNYLKNFSIPTLCTLPQIDEKEFMLHHAFSDLSCFEYFRNRVRHLEEERKIEPFHFILEDDFFKLKFNEYKWQCTGPVSMIETMEMHEYDQKMLNEYAQKIVLTQKKFNQKSSKKSYLFFDEPMLGTAPGMEKILIGFLTDLKKYDVFKNTIFGLHCCSKLEFDLTHLPVELIALDYSLYDTGEWQQLQSQLKARLVAINCDANGVKFEYCFQSEKYISSSCGQGISKISDLARLLDNLV